MRKLLALFGAVGLVSMSAATVVSCNDVADLGYYADSIENNLRTENYVTSAEDAAKGESIIMKDYFTPSGWFNAKGKAPIADDGSYPDQLKFEEFKGAIEMAINSVVSGSAKDTDYTYSIKSETIDSAQSDAQKIDLTSLNYATTVDNDDALATEKVAFDIHIDANKNSTLWKGTSDIYILAWPDTSKGGEQ
jgi:hypothetical protein